MIWHHAPTLEQATERCENTVVDHLGISFTEITDDSLSATMPVDQKTAQPIGILHGGSSCVLAETLGSVAANMCVNQDTHYCVGLSINASHIRQAKLGETVTGTATAIHLGRTTQVWSIKIINAQGQLICESRLTMMVCTRN